MILPLPADELQRLIEQGRDPEVPAGRIHLFDLREPEAFARGHVPGARHVPPAQALRWIPQRAETFETVVLIDDDGRPGGTARRIAAELAARWFRRLRYLAGGFASWGPERPLERGGATGESAASAEGREAASLTSRSVPWRVSEHPLPPDPDRKLPVLESGTDR